MKKKTYKAVIVDDEPIAINALAWEVARAADDFEIIKSFTDPTSALPFLATETLDVLFLDIEMPHLSGFDVLSKLLKIDFFVVFVTAYDTHAIQAFRANALDYLLKPVISEDLKETLNRIRENSRKRILSQQANQIQNTLHNSKKLRLVTAGEIQLVNTQDIIYCKADGSYITVVTTQGSHLLTKSLRSMEEDLNDKKFMRVHKSYLVNLAHIKLLVRKEGGSLTMSNGDSISVARRKKAELLRKM